MTSSTSTYRVSINLKDKVILLSKPLKECEYFKNNTDYICNVYKFNNEYVKVHKDSENNRVSHYTSTYKTALYLFENLKRKEPNYFFYNSLDN